MLPPTEVTQRLARIIQAQAESIAAAVRLIEHGKHRDAVECGILPEGKVLSTTGLLTIEPSASATLVCHAHLGPALAPAEAVVLTDLDCALGEGRRVADCGAT